MNFKPFLLFYQGSNLEFQDQNLTCYHYTIEQFFVASSSMFLDYGCKDTDIFYSCKYFAKKFHQNKHFSFSPVLKLQGLYIY